MTAGPVDSVEEVIDALHTGQPGTQLRYVVLSLGSQELREVTLQPVPTANRTLYLVQAAVAVFTLLVGASIRIRRPRVQATLHFFWLTVAFFGVFAFSFSGRLDRLDWVFYWADVIAILLLAPLFMHFALVFPERSPGWVQSRLGPLMLPLLYLPALVLGGIRAVVLSGGASLSGTRVTATIEALERLELAYLAICVVGGAAIMIRALRQVRSVTARRQLRWIVWGTVLGGVPFLGGYLLPFALGFDPPAQTELTVIPLGLIPLAFASAVIRYRLMDVEVIFKRAVVYTAAILAIAAIYAILLRIASAIFLGGSEPYNSVVALLATLVVVLLASPVKNAIQSVLDRAYYRDRYDYRRALVGFARDLNRDLDLQRLSERLVTRVTETFLVDRMALMLGPPDGKADADFRSIHAVGFGSYLPALPRASIVGTHLLESRTVVLDDLARRLDSAEIDTWRALGVHYFVPSVSADGTIAVLALGRKESGEPLSSEDMALLSAVAAQVATALEKRPALRAIARQGRRARPPARVQRERHRVLERWTYGGGSR